MDSRGRQWMVTPNITLVPALAQGGAQVIPLFVFCQGIFGV
jgi:hypothetical protein